MESILNTIKTMLGPGLDTTDFDVDVVTHINSALFVLTQLGVGPSEGFSISGDLETWSDFLGDDRRLESVKTYVYLKVKTVFDPPDRAAVLEAMNSVISELEWRLGVATDESQ